MFDFYTGVFNPFASEEISPPHTREWAAKRRLADALRNLAELAVTSDASVEQIEESATRLEQIASNLASAPRCLGTLAFMANGEHGSYGEINHELNAVGGQSNPLAPGLNQWLEGDVAHGTVCCGYAYEGPPGFVHGGHVAAILDQFLGMAQLAGGRPGMTGSLTVRYLRPTPLNTELRLRAEVVQNEGRKTVMRGEISSEGEVTATAEGLFIEPGRPIQDLGS
ncbi:PaaI family thioesterase [Parahaliea maris]|uniref:PaaI family thioesterase n=1 Tax=Parahaliea maris TaxID=2716870 RepID=A0A5C8ZW89_9GAMM|nr:PaaI family thioesterase [Parahaliea maris]TXS92825.1 PaaI family thioesterase [Parahaliea maris]